MGAGQNWQRRAKCLGVKGKTVKNRRAGAEKKIRDQESELDKMKGRPGFRQETRQDDNRRYKHKFILVHKPKHCGSHSICKGNDQFPGQAVKVTGGHGERGVHISLRQRSGPQAGKE